MPLYLQKLQTAVVWSLQGLGRLWIRTWIGQLSLLIIRSLWAGRDVFRPGVPQSQTFLQIFFTGVEITPVVIFLSLLMGTGVVLQALTVMPTVGFGDYFGPTMVTVVVRELSPVFTALLVAGRSGAGLTTHIAYMKVGSEIDALETMGIDPLRFLVFPALMGAAISLLCLNLIFSVTAIVGGLCSTAILHVFEPRIPAVHVGMYLDGLFTAMGALDLALVIFKPLLFGLLIAAIACHNGLRISNDPRQVPQAASSTVVSSFLAIVLANLACSALYIHQYLEQLRGFL